MELHEFKKYARNLNEFSVDEMQDLELMSDEELDWYQDELERGTGNLSDYHHLRVLFTLRSKM